MATVRFLKTFPKPRHRERVELSGEIYELVFTWRRRTEGWYVDVYRDDGTEVVLGRRLRPAADALAVTLDIEGSLIAVGPDFPSVEDMGSEFLVTYITSE